jgi:hypothetical protein
MTDLLPAPEYSIEMNSCKCKKTKFVREKCGCSSHGLKCTGLCKCIDCENVVVRFEEEDGEDFGEEDETEDDDVPSQPQGQGDINSGD